MERTVREGLAEQSGCGQAEQSGAGGGALIERAHTSVALAEHDEGDDGGREDVDAVESAKRHRACGGAKGERSAAGSLSHRDRLLTTSS